MGWNHKLDIHIFINKYIYIYIYLEPFFVPYFWAEKPSKTAGPNFPIKTAGREALSGENKDNKSQEELSVWAKIHLFQEHMYSMYRGENRRYSKFSDI